jgi:hypothetical protein
MDWIALVGAVGVGAVATKILDVVWLPRVTQRAAHAEWLRNQRLAAYTAVAEDFLSLGLNRNNVDNPFEGYAKISKALLLADDDKLAEEIAQYIAELDRFHVAQQNSTSQDEADRLYNQLMPKARVLVTKMRGSLTKV